MTECPNSGDKLTCGLAAAQDLIDRELIVVDYTARQMGETGVYIDMRGMGVMGALAGREVVVHAQGLVDMADFGCVACGKCVQVIDEYGDMSARLATE